MHTVMVKKLGIEKQLPSAAKVVSLSSPRNREAGKASEEMRATALNIERSSPGLSSEKVLEEKNREIAKMLADSLINGRTKKAKAPVNLEPEKVISIYQSQADVSA